MRAVIACFAAVLLVTLAPAGVAQTFGEDVSFLKKHCDPVILEGPDGQTQVAVVPLYQGRVMTSTARGADGMSFGWMNRGLISSGERAPHMNAFGGEDRFWLGPEGGQYSLYFDPGVPFDLEHWQVPEPIDWGAWEVQARQSDSVSFRERMRLVNYAGAEFDIAVRRQVSLLDSAEARQLLDVKPGEGVEMVAFRSRNTIENAGNRAWRKQSGLVSIWVLGQFKASPDTTVVIPYKARSGTDAEQVVNDAYFGEIADDRLKVEDGLVFFKADAESRGKIGIPPRYAKPVLGSYDAANGVLTIVHYTLSDKTLDYVNSLWKMQERPYRGDAVNSYNDGPTADGSQMGNFYELESSSPAAELEPGGTLTHVHRTFHLTGPKEELNRCWAWGWTASHPPCRESPRKG